MPEFDKDALRDMLKNMNSPKKEPKEEQPAEVNASDSSDEISFGVSCALRELDIMRKAWVAFQDAVGDLALSQVMLEEIRRTGDALAQAEISFSEDASKCGGTKAAERMLNKSRIVAAMLNKYQKEGEK